ncbi:hypothetical protein QUF72_00110 [Desulfobacterales bacterium HSG2]|nr:hypothetical protein [Desulfobacterales bacterium HSG2]
MANTPSYLYRHFRSDEAVEELAKKYSPDDLINFICQVDSDDNPSLQNIVAAYAGSVALTFHDLRSAEAVLTNIQINNLEWFSKVIQIWKDSNVSISIINVCSYPKIIEHEQFQNNSSTTITNIGDIL